MDVNTVIAANLKSIRDKNKFSLDHVAKITGVSKSMLGQIERGEANPSVTVLWKIANGLKISFTALMEVSEVETEVVRAENIIPLTEDEGKYRNFPIFPFDEKKRFEIYRIQVLPGGFLQASAHLTGTEEYITVYSGQIIVTVNSGNGETYTLHTGDSIRFKADTPHSYRNGGETVAELNMVIYYSK